MAAAACSLALDSLPYHWNTVEEPPGSSRKQSPEFSELPEDSTSAAATTPGRRREGWREVYDVAQSCGTWVGVR